MAGKGRKLAQHVEEDNEEKSEPSIDMQAVMKLILEGNEKAEARRVADAKALEISRVAEAKRAAADKLAEEERAEARRIAVEERAEARKRADKIAEEERAELRAEARRVRELKEKMAEAKAAEELERAREETARLASEKLLEQQEAMGARQYAQQVALIKMQAEIGEKAANAHRLEQTISKKRDRAVASIPNY